MEKLLSSDLMERYPTFKKYFLSRLQSIIGNTLETTTKEVNLNKKISNVDG